jgi:serine/tyrosine/threonine adenylyltransferase
MGSVPQPPIAGIADFLADPVAPADFPQTILRFRNDRAAASVGLDTLSDAAWTRHFGRFDPLPRNLPEPLALRYHGHQFRVYNPDIGDGRGFTFAQLKDERGRWLDLGTKGSGQTPYSRFGDGRLTLKGGVREILATEMLEALGVNTSKTFSLIETGEPLQRNDEPSPTRSAVLVRLSHGHIRIGSFQRLSTLGLVDEMSRLVRYTLETLYGETPGDDAPLRLLALVVDRAAALAASYMAAGFVHGVLNSDNLNVTGESFDYGPWRFTPFWDRDFVAAYFDQTGLYAFGQQGLAIHWDVVQLAIALTKLADVEALGPIMDGFPPAFEEAFVVAMLRRLGVRPLSEREDLALVQAIERGLESRAVGIDRFFFDHSGGRRRPGRYDATYDRHFADVETQLAAYAPARDTDHPYWTDPQPCSMHIDEVEAIWSAIDTNDDWRPLHDKVAAIRRMGEAHRWPN